MTWGACEPRLSGLETASATNSGDSGAKGDFDFQSPITRARELFQPALLAISERSHGIRAWRSCQWRWRDPWISPEERRI
jgi:hypothetical protein